MRAVLLVAVVVAGCGGGGGGDDVPGDDAPPVEQNSAVAVREVAAAIYDAVEAGSEDVAAYMEGVMLAMQVPAETEPAALEARLAAGLPAFMKPQTLDLASAYAIDNHVELDAFIAGMAEHGLHVAGGGPIDRAFLDARFGALLGKPQYAVDEVLPALVLALGAERAARYGGTDPVWGDGKLDPLQTTLILYAIAAEVSGIYTPAPAKGSARPHYRDAAGVVINYTIDHLQGEVETATVDAVEWPIGLDDLAQAGPCVSLALYGHKLTVTNTPDRIYHQQVDVASPPEFTTTINAELVFMDDYWDNYAQTMGFVYTTLIGLAGCNLPRQGTVPGKPLVWSVGPQLEGHGLYNFTTPVTGNDGEAVGLWGTVAETTPMQYRTIPNMLVANDSTKVRAGNLVPGWNTLALVAGGLKKLPDTGYADLTVRYYKNPCTGGLWTGAPGPGQCIDKWLGGSEATYTVPEGGYKMTGTGLVWEPVVTGGGETIYALTAGSVSYEMWQTGCTVTVDPPSAEYVGNPTAASDLDVMWETDPKTFSGNASIFWPATVTTSCPGEDPLVAEAYVGGQFFRANQDTPYTDVLADNYTLMEAWHYVFSFHR